MEEWGGADLLEGELANIVLDFERKKHTLDFKDSGRRVLDLQGSRSWMRVKVKMSRLQEAYDAIFVSVFQALRRFLLSMTSLKDDFAVLCAGGCWSNPTVWRVPRTCLGNRSGRLLQLRVSAIDTGNWQTLTEHGKDPYLNKDYTL